MTQTKRVTDLDTEASPASGDYLLLVKANGEAFKVDWSLVGGGAVEAVSNVPAGRILGRVTAGNGDSEELTAAQVRSLLNVENGATANSSVDGLDGGTIS